MFFPVTILLLPLHKYKQLTLCNLKLCSPANGQIKETALLLCDDVHDDGNDQVAPLFSISDIVQLSPETTPNFRTGLIK